MFFDREQVEAFYLLLLILTIPVILTKIAVMFGAQLKVAPRIAFLYVVFLGLVLRLIDLIEE